MQKITFAILFVVLLFLPLALLMTLKPKITFIPSASSPASAPFKGFGKALFLDGKTSYLKIQASEKLQPGLGFTAEMWIKPNTPEFSSVIAAKETENGDLFRILVSSVKDESIGSFILTYEFGVVNSGTDCAFHRVFQQRIIADDEAHIITSWQHIAGVVQDNGNLDIYVNGERSKTNFNKISGICESEYMIYIGANSQNGNARNFFPGLIDEIRISSLARYKSDFKSVLQPFEPDKDTLVLYHFDGNSKDESANGYDAVSEGIINYVDSEILLPSNPPVILTDELNDAYVGRSYRIKIEGSDVDADDELSLKISNLPGEFEMERCRLFKKNVDTYPAKVRFISCPLSGNPQTPGEYKLSVSLSDGFITAEKTLTLKILP